jgi:hypothetical protein
MPPPPLPVVPLAGLAPFDALPELSALVAMPDTSHQLIKDWSGAGQVDDSKRGGGGEAGDALLVQQLCGSAWRQP